LEVLETQLNEHSGWQTGQRDGTVLGSLCRSRGAGSRGSERKSARDFYACHNNNCSRLLIASDAMSPLSTIKRDNQVFRPSRGCFFRVTRCKPFYNTKISALYHHQSNRSSVLWSREVFRLLLDYWGKAGELCVMT